MEKEILDKLNELENDIKMVYVSAEKTRKYFLWTMIIGIAVTVLPLIGLAYAIPKFLSTLQMGQFGL